MASNTAWIFSGSIPRPFPSSAFQWGTLEKTAHARDYLLSLFSHFRDWDSVMFHNGTIRACVGRQCNCKMKQNIQFAHPSRSAVTVAENIRFLKKEVSMVSKSFKKWWINIRGLFSKISRWDTAAAILLFRIITFSAISLLRQNQTSPIKWYSELVRRRRGCA